MRRRWAGVLAMVAMLAAILLVPQVAQGRPAGATVSVASRPPCSGPYYIIGVRGSGQGYVGEFGMGGTVDPYVHAASAILPMVPTRYSLEYDAAPVSAGPIRWSASAVGGVGALLRTITDVIQTCPGIKIGLIGYSQGAFVVSSTMRSLPAGFRNQIRSVLLLADPLSPGAVPYAVQTTAAGQNGTRNGRGILRALLLPDDTWDRSTDFCIIGDPVCDATSTSSLLELLNLILAAPLHGLYPTCCGSFSFPHLLGDTFGRRLLDPAGYGRPAPPDPGPPPVTSLAGLPDGRLLWTSDTQRIYKLVGGAPVWQATCDTGICQGTIYPTTQAVINAGPATPRNGSSAIDQRGGIYLFVGGAPLLQASCAAPVNCGTPPKISDWSIDARDHMNAEPADGNLLQGWTGNSPTPVAETVGGAKIPFASPQEVIDTGYGSNWPAKVVVVSTYTYDRLPVLPRDTTLVQGAGGAGTPVAAMVGGARVNMASPQELLDTGYGSNWPSKVRAIPTRAFNLIPADIPRDGTLVQGAGAPGATPVAAMVGGVRINYANPDELLDTGYGGNLSWMAKVQAIPTRAFNLIPADIPRDGTLVQGAGGSATPVAEMVGGARVNFANPQEVIDTGYGSDWPNKVHAIPTRAFNLIPDRIADGTRIGDAASRLEGVVAGGARIAFATPADAGQTGALGKPLSLVPQRVWNAMARLPADGTLLRTVEDQALYGSVGGESGLIGDCAAFPDCPRAVAVTRPMVDYLIEVAPGGADWADANGDGKADYCRRVGDSQSQRVACTLSTGSGFGATIVSGPLDWGYPTGRAWVDVTGDGKADYCRVRGNQNHVDALISCSPSTGTGFGPDINSIGSFDWGYVTGREWADANGDGKADYCRRMGDTQDQRVGCTLSNGGNFTTTILSGPLDWGYGSGRAWVDATGDGKADYCRVRGNQNHLDALISCSPSTGTGFGGDINSIGALDWGYQTGRGWADANGDGKADYCRRVGDSQNQRVACTLSNGGNFTTTITSGPLDWGYVTGRAWVDATGDGKVDYCRVRGGMNITDALLSCSPSTGTGFGGDVNSIGALDWGYNTRRAWADANGDGKADYCRRVGLTNQQSSYVSCTLSNGGNFTTTISSGVVDWGYIE